MGSTVLNFSLNNTEKCTLEDPLRMILWAGDCINNGQTDIERLPNFDVYVSIGISQTLKANIDYLYTRNQPGVICIVDTNSDEQMQRFIKEFAGRITTIDADYHGNTPSMKPEYYHALLAPGGEAYNVEKISSLIMFIGDYINALELFAPILPRKLRDERRYTTTIIQLAKDNDLQVDFAWTSPELKASYYDEIRQAQENYSKYRKSLNPNHIILLNFTESNLEEYWSHLSPIILGFNYRRAISHNPFLEEIIEPYIDRFKTYLTKKLERNVDSVEEFTEQNLRLEQLQKLYTSIQYSQNFTGFSVHISKYRDLRYNGGPVVYNMWFRKISL
jgi:hypothetical protein